MEPIVTLSFIKKKIPYEIREDQGEKEGCPESSWHPSFLSTTCSRSQSAARSFQVFKALLIILCLFGNISHFQMILHLTLSQKRKMIFVLLPQLKRSHREGSSLEEQASPYHYLNHCYPPFWRRTICTSWWELASWSAPSPCPPYPSPRAPCQPCPPRAPPLGWELVSWPLYKVACPLQVATLPPQPPASKTLPSLQRLNSVET